MHVSMVMVQTLNGKITRGDDPHIYSWTSKEDQDFFFGMIEENSLIIMGRKTYEAAKSLMKHRPGKLRVVMTTNSEKYKKAEISGQLEFSNMNPGDLLSNFAKKGYKKALLVGGASINELFLAENLVDELFITIEPYIFSKGRDFLAGESTTVLQLNSVKQLNPHGTLLLNYSIKRA